MLVHGSTKTYTHNTGLSCCFRQWRAKSHCNMLHGYALQVEVEFEAATLDERNWVVDFGGLKMFKAWLEDMFDHTTCVAKDDPEMKVFTDMMQKGMIDLRVVDAVGCEAFAQMCYEWLSAYLNEISEYKDRVIVKQVMVREHAGNSGYVRKTDV